MKLLRTMLITIAAVLATSCSESSFSSSDNKKTPVAAKEPMAKPQPVPASDVAVPSDPCTDSGVTQVKLLTLSAKNNSANQTLRYEVSLLDCNGKPLPIPQAPLLFDVDSQSMELTARATQFTIQDSQGQTVTSGSMEKIDGSDLFGKQSETHYHWKADNLQIPVTDYKFYFIADVSNRIMTEFGVMMPPTSGSVQFDTYLRIGDAAPVQQKITWSYDK